MLTDRERIAATARAAFEETWRRGDPWELDTADAVRSSYERQLELLADRRYRRALEIGCGAGAFTSRLAELAETVLAVDIAEAALARARERGLDPARVEFRRADATDLDPGTDGPFDLVVVSETLYCIGWLYPLFDLGWLISQLYEASRPGGRLLVANTYGTESDPLLSPWLIDTYRDLVRNVGWTPTHEETIHVTKDGVDFRLLISLFERAGTAR